MLIVGRRLVKLVHQTNTSRFLLLPLKLLLLLLQTKNGNNSTNKKQGKGEKETLIGERGLETGK
jgi:hypothetical protein